MRTYLAGLVLGAITLSAATALAHHSFEASYDMTRPSHLEGKVTKIEWANPHVFVMLNAKDGAGSETQ